ncbi:DUF924 family protein [Aquibaculum arenosum]|uniref:DUF924 domain-containing protein n=1 Tax=Aquibaculum arenosum TaxID=3032591 RepID=A0ABT5YNI8_9PROT|nr:DUF924 family protein [Fodinicurvata sp. CAU 1616]MDF2096515.1 DUF924 domain-containing protein [Fodinicurvata sp. CAU 1616]
MNNPAHDPEQVLAFWFAPGREVQWFVRSDAFDAQVEETLGSAYRQAQEGGFNHWAREARGALALILLLDQVPRQLHRGSPEAFVCDARARTITEAALAAGQDQELGPAERLFLYLPLEHSEDLADQERAVALISALGDDEWTRYAVIHRNIIARFGRFPHRNAALGRQTTAEEAAFLQEPESSF